MVFSLLVLCLPFALLLVSFAASLIVVFCLIVQILFGSLECFHVFSIQFSLLLRGQGLGRASRHCLWYRICIGTLLLCTPRMFNSSTLGCCLFVLEQPVAERSSINAHKRQICPQTVPKSVCTSLYGTLKPGGSSTPHNQKT